MDLSILEELGITGAEIKVFIALLELGQTNPGKIVEKSGLHNAVVHRALHSLGEKGLITHILNGKTKQYSAANPNVLLNYLDEKKDRLKKILPELELKQETAENKPQAMIFEGKKGLRYVWNTLLNEKSEMIYDYGGSNTAHEALGDEFWEWFHKTRVDKKKNAKFIFHESLKWQGGNIETMPLSEVRYTKKEFEELTETAISGNKVAIIIHTEKPTIFFIDNELVARSYIKFFEMLWEHAQ